MTTAANQNFGSIQILRAVAALFIFIYHVCDRLAYEYGYFDHNVFVIGPIGVDIFFVVSGFIICHATERSQAIGPYFVKRITRVLPLYYVLTTGILLIAFIAPQLLGSTDANLLDYVRSLAFIPYERAVGDVKPLLFLGWTLNYEMFFYVLFAVALAWGRRRVLVISLMISGLYALGRIIKTDSVIFNFYTDPFIIDFVYGCIIYAAYQHFGDRFKVLGRYWPLAAALVIGQNFVHVPLPREISAGVPAALLLATLLTVQLPRWKPVQFLEDLGDASYSFYLIHPYVMQLVLKVVIGVLGVSLFSVSLAFSIVTVATVVAALLMFRYFEMPANRILRDWLLKPSPDA